MKGGKPAAVIVAAMRYLLDSLTDRLLACYDGVRRQLPLGLELSSYVRALALDCRRAGMQTVCDRPFDVRYGGEVVGQYRAALVVDGLVLVEPRQANRLTAIDQRHLLGALRTSGLPLGLVLNFGARRESCRVELWPAVARVAEPRPSGPGLAG
ncbi:MAG: GxxExxY protein [Gemmatimonadaceae bacterium]|uniref:GxxExxY protein n=2 Tax=Gemmatimonas sp. TaxID=1962908 RepID=UPI00391F6995|nr:GxxExxY protein [Gemmatimonadota bacterium]